MRLSLLFAYFAMLLPVQNSYAIVFESAEKVKPLIKGKTIPDVTLQGADGKTYSLRKLAKKHPLILVFYRGGWCPYCNTHLADLRKIQTDLKKIKVKMIAISPDHVNNLKKTTQKHQLSYILLSDAKGAVAARFGLAFQIDEKTRKKYKSYGIDLEKASGERHFTLPVPAIYVVNKSGIIQFVHYDANYKQRLDANSVLKAAQKAL